MGFGLANKDVYEKLCTIFRAELDCRTFDYVLAKDRTVKALYPEDVGDLLFKAANLLQNYLASKNYPVPPLTFWDLGDKGTMAQFSPRQWTVQINDKLLSFKADKIAVPTSVAKTIFKNLYHEFRHAEQFSVIIRYFWSLHPKWLAYQELAYDATRTARTSAATVQGAWREWHYAVKGITSGELNAKIARSLTTPAGESPEAGAVLRLADKPLRVDGDFSQADFDQVARWYQSRFRTWVEELAGRRSLLDEGRMIEVDETTGANLALAEANLYADTVDTEIKEWNSVKPTRVPSWQIQMSLPQALDVSAVRVKPFDRIAMSAIHAYLSERRGRALKGLKFAYTWYSTVPLEADTHDIEKRVADLIELKDASEERVAKRAGVLKEKYLPIPKDWSAEV